MNVCGKRKKEDIQQQRKGKYRSSFAQSADLFESTFAGRGGNGQTAHGFPHGIKYFGKMHAFDFVAFIK